MPQYNPPTSIQQGAFSRLNLAAAGGAQLVKVGKVRAARVSVIVAGSAAGGVFDAATTGAAATANQIFVIPNTVGIYTLDWPVNNGLVVTPGTGQTVAVSYL